MPAYCICVRQSAGQQRNRAWRHSWGEEETKGNLHDAGSNACNAILLNPKADTAAMWQIPRRDLCPVVISGEWRLWNAILTGSSNISGNKTIQHKANWPKGAEQHLFCKWMQAKHPNAILSSAIFSQYIQGQSFLNAMLNCGKLKKSIGIMHKQQPYCLFSKTVFKSKVSRKVGRHGFNINSYL